MQMKAISTQWQNSYEECVQIVNILLIWIHQNPSHFQVIQNLADNKFSAMMIFDNDILDDMKVFIEEINKENEDKVKLDDFISKSRNAKNN